jgi:hypothetical protein
VVNSLRESATSYENLAQRRQPKKSQPKKQEFVAKMSV